MPKRQIFGVDICGACGQLAYGLIKKTADDRGFIYLFIPLNSSYTPPR